jgi:hypothetical protein
MTAGIQSPEQPTQMGDQPGQARQAAQRATAHNSTRIIAPVLGAVDLPSTEELAFIGGIGLLAVVGVLEWPIAATLAVGHLFASNRRNKTLRDFGSALEEA